MWETEIWDWFLLLQILNSNRLGDFFKIRGHQPVFPFGTRGFTLLFLNHIQSQLMFIIVQSLTLI